MVDGVEPLVPALENLAVPQQGPHTSLHRRAALGLWQRAAWGARALSARDGPTLLSASTYDCTCGFCRMSEKFSLLGVPSQLTVGPTLSTSELRRSVKSLCQVRWPCSAHHREDTQRRALGAMLGRQRVGRPARTK